MNSDTIISILNNAIRESQKYSHSRKKWTLNIKEKFLKETIKEKLYMCTSGIKKTNWGEWLYDLVVLEYDHLNEYINKTVLVLESEWNTDNQSILEDFQKLLLSNSDYKIFMYYKNDNIKNTLKEMISKYKKSNGEYIIAFLPSNNSDLEIEKIKGNLT